MSPKQPSSYLNEMEIEHEEQPAHQHFQEEYQDSPLLENLH